LGHGGLVREVFFREEISAKHGRAIALVAEDYFVFAVTLNIVIPGRDEVASPESITTACEYGFRARRLRVAQE
jgi:hypothetical protein